MSELQQTILPTNQTSRVDLIQGDFDSKIVEKGLDVIYETAIQCPCKGKSTNAKSTCKNCGGVGYMWINPTQTKMLLQSLDAVSKQEGWSEELQGTVRITALSSQNLAQRDRITDLHGEAIYNEVLHFKKANNQIFAYTAYPVKQILYIGLFIAIDQPLQRLENGIDYIISGNVLTLLNKADVDVTTLSVAVRYKHAPSFYIIEMRRESFQSARVLGGSEKMQSFPVSAYGKRAHYMPDLQNLSGDRLLSNNFTDPVICNVNGDPVAQNGSAFILRDTTTGVSYQLTIQNRNIFYTPIELQSYQQNYVLKDTVTGTNYKLTIDGGQINYEAI